MNQAHSDNPADQNKPKEKDSILGFSTSKAANLNVDDLVGNKIAIQMLLNYYNETHSTDESLTNEINTLRTYQTAYTIKKSNSVTAVILLSLSNLFLGFGINNLSGSNPSNAGWLLLLSAFILIGSGIYFTFFKDQA